MRRPEYERREKDCGTYRDGEMGRSCKCEYENMKV